MSKKIKILIASALVLTGNTTVFAMEQNHLTISKKMFDEYSVYESSKRIKLNPEITLDKKFNYEIIEIPNCTKQALKITPGSDYTDNQTITEEEIRQFLLSKETIFNRQYKCYILGKNNAIAYADAIIIDSKIKTEDNFLSKNENWCKPGDNGNLILKKDYNIYTKIRLKDKFYDTEFYTVRLAPPPSEKADTSTSDPFSVLTYGGEYLEKPKNFDTFLENGDTSEYYKYEMTSAQGYAQKVLKITPKYSDSLDHEINWESVKKYLLHNKSIFEYLNYLSKTDYSNPLEKLDAILIYGSGEPTQEHNQSLYENCIVYRKGDLFKLFIKKPEKNPHSENLLKAFAKKESEKTLATSSPSPSCASEIRKEIINDIRLSAFKILPNNLYALSITPKSFDSYRAKISEKDIQNFTEKNKDILKTSKVSGTFSLTDYFDIIIFDKGLINYAKIKPLAKNFAHMDKPYNLGIIVKRDAIRQIPPNSFFKNFKLSYDKDLEHIISDGKSEPWNNVAYAESPELSEHESHIKFINGKFHVDPIPQDVKRYFKVKCRRSLNPEILNDYILSAEIYPDEIPKS